MIEEVLETPLEKSASPATAVADMPANASNGDAPVDNGVVTPAKPKRATRAKAAPKAAPGASATDTPAPEAAPALPFQGETAQAEAPPSAHAVAASIESTPSPAAAPTSPMVESAPQYRTSDTADAATESGTGERNGQDGSAQAPAPIPEHDYPSNQAPIQSMRPRLDEREGRSFEGRNEQGRNIESRGLRFRGREGRAEVRGRDTRGNEVRGFRPRNEGRNDIEPNGFNGRTAQPQRDQMPRENLPQNRAESGRSFDNRAERDAPREMGRDLVRNRSDADSTVLEEKNINELRDMAGDLGINVTPNMKKHDLVFRILEAQSETSGGLIKKGILEILPDGKGFLRTEGYLPGNEDVYVSQSQIKRFNLRTGDMVSGQVRAPKEMERYYGLLRVDSTNGDPPDITRSRKEFEKLTPIFPDEKFKLETTQENITARIIDLVSPIGKGQRGLIVAPPKAGKTTLIKNIANSIVANHPEVYLIVLLIDERPEEVTDISRSVRGEVVASTFDEMPDNHVRVADMVLEKAKRMVEQKKDVVILLDSITRLSRASNLVVTPSGRTMSGGLDPAAMHKPKRMFGAARNIEEGGSLTILATALVDTGSRMDDYIFEEFKGTGNLDLVLDRSLFDQRIFPAIDINRSGTRRDDLLLSKDDLATVFHLRRTLASLDNDKAITLLIDRLKNTKSNEDFMAVVQKSARQSTTQ